MESVASGLATDQSDRDVCGWAIPPRADVFPHLRGDQVFRADDDNNPDIIDTLFDQSEWGLHATKVGALARENRRRSLHRGTWSKFRGYAESRLHKLTVRKAQGTRAALVTSHGFNTKFAYHVVRVLGEVEQILTEGDLELQRQRDIL